jgi:hypothetical protein
MLGSSSEEAVPESEEETITQDQATQLIKRFNVEGRNRRSILKARVQREWAARINEGKNRRSILQARGTNPTQYEIDRQNTTPRIVDQMVVHEEPCPDSVTDSSTPDISFALDNFLSHRLVSGGILDVNVAFDEFLSLQLNKYDSDLCDNKRLFLDEIHRRKGGVTSEVDISDELRQKRTVVLWAGLRRVFFHEVEPESDDSVMEGASPINPRRRIPIISSDMNAPALHCSDEPDDSDDTPMHLGIGDPLLLGLTKGNGSSLPQKENARMGRITGMIICQMGRKRMGRIYWRK